MSTSKRIFCVCLLTYSLVCSFTADVQINAKPGNDVRLQCQGPGDAGIRMLKWSRPDLKSEGFVFYFRENRPYENYQHPSFRGRVKLRDPERKNGDFSVILKNVNNDDSGTYECYVGYEGEPELINTITLTVDDSGHTGGHKGDRENQEEKNKDEGNSKGNVRLGVGLSVSVLVVGIVGLVIYKNCR